MLTKEVLLLTPSIHWRSCEMVFDCCLLGRFFGYFGLTLKHRILKNVVLDTCLMYSGDFDFGGRAFIAHKCKSGCLFSYIGAPSTHFFGGLIQRSIWIFAILAAFVSVGNCRSFRNFVYRVCGHGGYRRRFGFWAWRTRPPPNT